MDCPLVFIHIFLLIHWTHPSQSNTISFFPTWKMEMEEGQYPHLFNNKLLLRAVCSGHSHGMKSRCTHTHTEQHFPHFIGTNPKQLNLQEPRFHFKARMGHPKAIKQPHVIHFGAGGCPGNAPLDGPAGLSFPTHCYSPTLEIRLGHVSHPLFPGCKHSLLHW